MRNLDEINLGHVLDGDSYAPPTRDLIAKFESEFGYKLPPDYIELLMYSNGGHPELDSFIPTGATTEEECLGINNFYKLNSDRNDTEGLWFTLKVWRPVLEQGLLPIASDGGGNIFVLDCEKHPFNVYFCDHEEDFTLYLVSNSFSNLIDSLHIHPDFR